MTNLANSTEGRDASPLDPKDWDEFRSVAHQLLDACVDRMAGAAQLPWKPVNDEFVDAIQLQPSDAGVGLEQVAAFMASQIMPLATGNTHPRFFGWVHGTGLGVGLLAEMVASAMNSNCGGRDHGAVYVEREVLKWCANTFGMPVSSAGVLTTGTSQATVIALACARQVALGPSVRSEGLWGLPRLAAYAVAGAHNAIVKALELLGLGSSALRMIGVDESGAIDLKLLQAAIDQDRARGLQPFCVIGTAGSVDLGRFDPLDSLADLCRDNQLWLHVDGAFGAWAVLAQAPWKDLAKGLERADSVAFDFHKWMFVQYDCGAVLVNREDILRATFAARPAYLATQSQGLGGGEPWFCDHGIDLSRGFRALKVWAALRHHGRDAFGAAITRTCQLAQSMAHEVRDTPELELSSPVISNICCFRAIDPAWSEGEHDAINTLIAQRLQLEGDAVLSTTKVDGRTVLRAAIANHRTAQLDITSTLSAVVRLARELAPVPGIR